MLRLALCRQNRLQLIALALRTSQRADLQKTNYGLAKMGKYKTHPRLQELARLLVLANAQQLDRASLIRRHADHLLQIDRFYFLSQQVVVSHLAHDVAAQLHMSIDATLSRRRTRLSLQLGYTMSFVRQCDSVALDRLQSLFRHFFTNGART